VKSLMLLWNAVAADMATGCRTSAHRDVKYVKDRLKHEGVSFLTITLPTFAKDFELSLERGYVGNDVFLSYKKNGSLPAFLQGFSCLVFNRNGGVLLTEPSIPAIQAIRQLTLLFSKVLLECSSSRVTRAFREFVDCESEVKLAEGTRNYHPFRRISSLLFSTMFSEMDEHVYRGELAPKHGPGATADSLVGNQKYHQLEWTCRLETYFPFLEMVLPNLSYWEVLDEVDFREPEMEIPVKVIPVPKTMKTPRIIAVEPTAMQYCQQALLRLFQEALDKSIIKSFIGLKDQAPNQRMAKRGSSDGSLATLDLSEASDRVSSETVSALLSQYKHLHDASFACRSTRARLPGGEVLTLSKFASMGSALTFPYEAAVFLTAIFVGIERDLGRRLVPGDIKRYLGRVRVYGDDIIIPVEHVHSVIASLEYFGLKVNSNKSFWKGKFRESCGKEYYDERDVSLVRCRRSLPSSRKDVQEIIATVAFRNQCFLAGLESTVAFLDDRMLKLLEHFPTVNETSPVLGRLSWSHHYGNSKMKNSISMVKGWMIRPVIPKNEISDWPALRKCLSSLEERPMDLMYGPSGLVLSSPDHLRRSGRPRVVDIKLGWGPIGF